MSLSKSFIKLFVKGLSKQSWCFTHGAFVLNEGNVIFNILMHDGKAYKRISSHQKRFMLNNNTNKNQYGYDFKPIRLHCNGTNVIYRTILFFKLPKNRIYVKFEQYGTKKAYNTVLHGINYARTRFETPRNNFRKEKLPPFTYNFPSDWNQNENAVNYHKNRVGREVFLSIESLIKVLESGMNRINIKKSNNGNNNST